MKNIKLILSLLSFVLFLGMNAFAQKEVNKSFEAKKTLKISTVSGDCSIEKASGNKIEVNLTYTYSDDCFEYIFNEESAILEIKEKFEKNSNCKGMSEWTIQVPEDVEIIFGSASGNLSLNGIKNGVKASTASGDINLKMTGGLINISTASGDIEVEDAKGDLTLSTASGDVTIEKIDGSTKVSTASGDVEVGGSSKGLTASTASGKITAHDVSEIINLSTASGNISVRDAKGALKLSTASGDIDITNAQFTEEGSIKSASGNIFVVLSKSMDYDLTLANASGDIVLDYNGNALKGYYEFSARVDKGEIISPEPFDEEQVIEKHGKEYDVKSFTKGTASPKILLKTSSGKVKLIK